MDSTVGSVILRPVLTAPNADRFALLPAARLAFWTRFSVWNRPFFSGHLGIQLEEIRVDYARMRLPFRTELAQPAGVLHGGAITTLIDTVVVPAIGSAFDEFRPLFTIDLQVQFLEPVTGDAVAEGWIVKRGRSTVFCRAEVRTMAGLLAATGTLVYKVGSKPVPAPGS